MLKFIGGAFTKIIEVALWLFLIAGAVFGGFIGYLISPYGSVAILGAIIGFGIAFLVSAVFAGPVVVLLDIRERIQNIEKKIENAGNKGTDTGVTAAGDVQAPVIAAITAAVEEYRKTN